MQTGKAKKLFETLQPAIAEGIRNFNAEEDTGTYITL